MPSEKSSSESPSESPSGSSRISARDSSRELVRKLADRAMPAPSVASSTASGETHPRRRAQDRAHRPVTVVTASSAELKRPTDGGSTSAGSTSAGTSSAGSTTLPASFAPSVKSAIHRKPFLTRLSHALRARGLGRALARRNFGTDTAGHFGCEPDLQAGLPPDVTKDVTKDVPKDVVKDVTKGVSIPVSTAVSKQGAVTRELPTQPPTGTRTPSSVSTTPSGDAPLALTTPVELAGDDHRSVALRRFLNKAAAEFTGLVKVEAFVHDAMMRATQALALHGFKPAGAARTTLGGRPLADVYQLVAPLLDPLTHKEVLLEVLFTVPKRVIRLEAGTRRMVTVPSGASGLRLKLANSQVELNAEQLFGRMDLVLTPALPLQTSADVLETRLSRGLMQALARYQMESHGEALRTQIRTFAAEAAKAVVV